MAIKSPPIQEKVSGFIQDKPTWLFPQIWIRWLDVVHSLINKPEYALTSISGIYTITINDVVIECTSGTFTVTLPPAATVIGRFYFIHNSGTGVITLEGDGSETINKTLNKTIAENDAAQVYSNGSNWIIL